ncbi:MAG: SpoIIE family protein phosphatase [Oscillospiraceae bacterium]|nr:SpoIIE family protein phosphatase [Oscillospiraceae bacterium]
MENRTELVGVGLGEQSRQILLERQELLLQLLWGLFSYVIAAGNMLEGLSPFGVALMAACPQRLLLATAIGATGGSLFPAGVAMSMKYAAAVMVAAVARWAFCSGKLLRWSQGMAPLLAGVSLLLPSLAVALAEELRLYDLGLAAAESFLAAGAAWFFARSVTLLGQEWSVVKKSDALCGIVSLCILLLSLSAFSLFGLSLGRVAAGLALLICAVSGGESTGTICGAACGMTIGLASFPELSAVGQFALCGLLTGVFSPMGKFACSIAFVLSGGIFSLLTHAPSEALPFLWEGAISSTIFMLIPTKRLQTLRIRGFRQLDHMEAKGMKELLLAHIEDASAALSEIARSTKQVSDSLNQLQTGSVEEVYQAAIDGVCRKCSQNINCWQLNFSDSMNCFNHFTDLLRKNGRITEEDFLYPLSGQCKKKEKLLGIINSRYEAFLEKEGLRRKVAQVRSVVTDQFEGMAEMLQGFGEEMLQISSCDSRLTQRLQVYLEEKGLGIKSVNCYRDQEEVLFLQLFLPAVKLPRIDQEELTDELSGLCGCQLDDPEVVCRGKEARLTFRELASYAMDYAWTQHICDGSRVCGDSCSSFTDHRSVAHMILSDGMGNGSGAAVDSAMTVSLLSKLIDANVAYDPALKIVNSALLVKSGEESLATIDIAAVDLYKGQATFYKAGAAPTFIRRHQRTGYVESISLPVGILSSVQFEKSQLQLSEGDLIVMVSDGAITSGLDWIRHTIDRFDEADGLQSLCDDITTTARLKRNDHRDDDITVLAGILRKR